MAASGRPLQAGELTVSAALLSFAGARAAGHQTFT